MFKRLHDLPYKTLAMTQPKIKKPHYKSTALKKKDTKIL